MLRSTWRGLETWHGRDGVTLANEGARQRRTQTSTYTGAPVLDPTDERGWETERCRMAQATAPILDSTYPAESGCPRSQRVLEGKRTLSNECAHAGDTCAT